MPGTHIKNSASAANPGTQKNPGTYIKNISGPEGSWERTKKDCPGSRKNEENCSRNVHKRFSENPGPLGPDSNFFQIPYCTSRPACPRGVQVAMAMVPAQNGGSRVTSEAPRRVPSYTALRAKTHCPKQSLASTTNGPASRTDGQGCEYGETLFMNLWFKHWFGYSVRCGAGHKIKK